ncbi:hypothetical protein ACLSSQ_17645 [Azospira sp. APE16]|uniref:phosphoribosyltransferase-like protein n=1 Tax=Azospira sp. APE16 TaxID=3394231 RepID=UPI003A4E455D
MTRLFDEWQQFQERERECSDLMGKLDLYAARLFGDYEPLITPLEEIPRDFFERLDRWLRNFKGDTDRWNAFKLVDDIFFVGRHELNELYRLAFDHIACDWLVAQKNLHLDDPKFEEKLETARNRTWFCPITDSLRINAFRHINHISSPDYFPDWRSLALFGDIKKINNYIENRIDHLVLIEDFIGTGTQVEPAIKFVKDHLKIPTLVVPLIICPTGDLMLRKVATQESRIHYRPVLQLPPACVIAETPAQNEPDNVVRNRNTVESYRAITADADPYGFESGYGSLVVMHTNCPNNTIRPIHSQKRGWLPLFPRSTRRKAK